MINKPTNHRILHGQPERAREKRCTQLMILTLPLSLESSDSKRI